MQGDGGGVFVTKTNFICHGHVTRKTFRNVAPQGREKCSKWRERTKPDCSVWRFVAPPITDPHSV